MTRDQPSATSSTSLQSLSSDEFLPPLSRWTTLGGLFLSGTFVAAIALAATLKYSPTIKAPAIVRPAGDIQMVQATTEGTLETILVSENQRVKQGDAIAKIDDSRLRTQKSHIEENIQQCEKEVAQVTQQIRQLEAQILATVQSVTGQTDPLTEAKAAESALVQLASLLPEVAQQLARDRRILLVKQSDLQKQLTQGKKDLSQLETQLENSVVRAPTDGTILKVELRNPGQTVQSGSAIAQIVPSDVPLVIKAKVTAQDIGQVKVNQPVNIRISAFPYPDYGTLNGTVGSIAPDAILPEMPNQDAYYEVTIEPERTYFMKESGSNLPLLETQDLTSAQPFSIQSGMEGRADIIASEETVLTFLLRKARLLTDF